MSLEKRIFCCKPAAGASLIERLRRIPVANIADVMGRTRTLHPRIRLVSSPDAPILAGQAVTVNTRAGDNLAIHAALDLCSPGDVLIVACEDNDSRALMGEVMFGYLRFRGAGGVIIDAPIRDIGTVKNWTLPIYCTGTTPGGPYKEGPGEVNVPVSCGGVVVYPGDIVVADADGVVIIPLLEAPTIVEAAEAFQRQDAEKAQAALNGTSDRSWLEQLLDEKGFERINRAWNDL